MKSITILGAGESGIGAALLAKKNSINVFVSDFGLIKEKYKIELELNNIPFEERGHDFERLKLSDYIIKSPGIPASAKILQQLKSSGVKVISEIEFASFFYSGKIIGITGSNGKTTTTSMIYHVLKHGGYQVSVGGNIGVSFSRKLLTDHDSDWFVLELSSYQLEDIDSFQADIAVIINITADHLDSYNGSMYKYASAKWNLVRTMRSSGKLIYNATDEWIELMKVAAPPGSPTIGIEFWNGKLQSKGFQLDQEIANCLKLGGWHNVFNAKLAYEVAIEIGMKHDHILECLSEFRGIEHRMEDLGLYCGVRYINDSKATNIDSAKMALSGIRESIIWIAGGTDKGNDYEVLDALVTQKVKAIICLTKDDRKLQKAFKDKVVEMLTTEDIIECVKFAQKLAEAGDVVLLSPACASFDLFDNYEDRGNKFKEAVTQLGLG